MDDDDGLWGGITDWLFKPFREPLDPTHYALMIILSATLAYAWSRVLQHVLEE